MADTSNFDPTADRFDAARYWPDSVAAAFTAALTYVLAEAPQPTLVEVECGTGRIASQLKSRGFQVVGTGTEVSLLREGQFPDLVVTPPKALPFARATFDLVYTIQPLYADEHWKKAVGEIRRVLVPGGVYANRFGTEVSSDVSNHMDVGWYNTLKRNGVELGFRPETRSKERFDTFMRESGAAADMIRVGRWREEYSPRKRLERTAARKSVALRNIPDSIFKRLLEDYERWLKSQYGKLDSSLEILNEVALDIWRWN
jgi:SAM-dependent methyltransferase